MAAKEMKRIESNTNLTQMITEAIQQAHQAGMSGEDVKAILERFVSLLEEE